MRRRVRKMIKSDEEKLINIEAFLTKVDRILSGKDVDVILESNRGKYYVARTNGKKIFINLEHFPEFDWSRDYKEIKGLDYHELAHVMLTPYYRFYYKIAHILNALEDGRVETLFSLEYPKAKLYFLHSFLKFIKSDLDNPLVFLLVYSRRLILPKQFVEYSEKVLLKYLTKNRVEELKYLIDRFVLEESDRMRMKIAERVYEIMKDIARTILLNPKLQMMLSTTSYGSPSKKLTKKLIEKAKTLKEKMEKESKEKLEEIKNSNDKAEINDKAGISDKAEISDKVGKLDRTEIEKIIEEESKKIEVEIEQDVMEDIKAIFSGAKGASGGTGEEIEADEISGNSNRYLILGLKNKFASELRKIKTENDFEWLTRNRSGKIVVSDWIRGRFSDLRVFRKWKVGSVRKLKTYIGIIVDKSGSMRDYIPILLSITASFGRALEEVNLGDEDIVVFSDYFGVVKKFGKNIFHFELLDRIVSCGTIISSSLEHMFKAFSKVEGKKILFVFSDFDFADYDLAISLFRKFVGVKVVGIIPNTQKHLESYKDDFPNVEFCPIEYKDVDELVKIIRRKLEELRES